MLLVKWTLLIATVLWVICGPIPEPNEEFNRILHAASIGNLSQNKNVKDVDPYVPKKTLLDRYLENPGTYWHTNFVNQFSTF